jgi:hypothetical protein
VLPAAGARSLALWGNAAEAAEKRKDACVAREVEVALPHEPYDASNVRNHDAHWLTTTRQVSAERRRPLAP